MFLETSLVLWPAWQHFFESICVFSSKPVLPGPFFLIDGVFIPLDLTHLRFSFIILLRNLPRHRALINCWIEGKGHVKG